jgi:hypothetical protein
MKVENLGEASKRQSFVKVEWHGREEGFGTHCGEGAPQSQHLSFPLPCFFWIWWSY